MTVPLCLDRDFSRGTFIVPSTVRGKGGGVNDIELRRGLDAT